MIWNYRNCLRLKKMITGMILRNSNTDVYFSSAKSNYKIYHKKTKAWTQYRAKRHSNAPWQIILEWITMRLESRYIRNKNRLSEKNQNKKSVHERTLKAYKSLKNNLQYLYMFEKFSKLGLPQTNNSLEAINSHLKTKSNIHRWLSEERKHQFTSYYLYIS